MWSLDLFEVDRLTQIQDPQGGPPTRSPPSFTCSSFNRQLYQPSLSEQWHRITAFGTLVWDEDTRSTYSSKKKNDGRSHIFTTSCCWSTAVYQIMNALWACGAVLVQLNSVEFSRPLLQLWIIDIDASDQMNWYQITILQTFNAYINEIKLI